MAKENSEENAATYGDGRLSGSTPSSSRTWIRQISSGSCESSWATFLARSRGTPRLVNTAASSACSATGRRTSSRCSLAISARTSSIWECTDVHSPTAIEKAPASSPATPVMTTTWVCVMPVAAAMPAISETLVTSPSIAPNTAGRSQPPFTSRWLWLCCSAFRSTTVAASLTSTSPPTAQQSCRLRRTNAQTTTFLVRSRPFDRLGGDPLVGSGVAPQHEIGHGRDEEHDARPVVEAQAEEPVRVVDAERLDPAAARRVGRDVESERPPVAEPPPAVGPDDEQGDAEVPERLIEKGGMEGPRATAGSMRGVDLHRPRQ